VPAGVHTSVGRGEAAEQIPQAPPLPDDIFFIRASSAPGPLAAPAHTRSGENSPIRFLFATLWGRDGKKAGFAGFTSRRAGVMVGS